MKTVFPIQRFRSFLAVSTIALALSVAVPAQATYYGHRSYPGQFRGYHGHHGHYGGYHSPKFYHHSPKFYGGHYNRPYYHGYYRPHYSPGVRFQFRYNSSPRFYHHGYRPYGGYYPKYYASPKVYGAPYCW